ncbi:MAG: hypothetical protein GY870_15885 [archaeon]|nr:hypothetical protein [archaeon]
MGLNQLWMQKSPFDVFLSLPTGEQMGVDLTESFISSVFPSIDKKDENANKDRLALISKMMNAIRLSGTAFVEDPIDAKKCKLAHIPVIEKKELKEVKNPKEFKKLVRKKI